VKHNSKLLLLILSLFCIQSLRAVEPLEIEGRWSKERINKWYAEQPWFVGCNYIPANAINQIEMWQKSTFDSEIIKKELDLAQSIGFNFLRVYLHDLVWANDEQGFYNRIDQFLSICDERGISVSFVFFDDCHHPLGKLGPQPLPVPEYHNSGWLNSPTRDIGRAYSDGTVSPKDAARLKGYVQGTMKHFKNDPRIAYWELYNEPGRGRGLEGDMASTKIKNTFGDKSAKLLLDAWKWAREVNPSQPMNSTAEGGVGKKNYKISHMNSDLGSFHNYSGPRGFERTAKRYAKSGRPAMCTEYLARPHNTFQKILPILKKYKIGAVNWGFVAGKTGCVYDWKSRVGKDLDKLRADGNVVKDYKKMPLPKTWFHEIFKPDHTPYDQAEIDFIKQITETK